MLYFKNSKINITNKEITNIIRSFFKQIKIKLEVILESIKFLYKVKGSKV